MCSDIITCMHEKAFHKVNLLYQTDNHQVVYKLEGLKVHVHDILALIKSSTKSFTFSASFFYACPLYNVIVFDSLKIQTVFLIIFLLKYPSEKVRIAFDTVGIVFKDIFRIDFISDKKSSEFSDIIESVHSSCIVYTLGIYF